MANEWVLVVEDEGDLLENNLEYMALQGYRTLAAATLAEARAVLRETPADLILLDVNLPDGSGFELAADAPEETAVLYLTGRTADEDVVRGLGRDRGGVDYLKKPFSYAELGARAAALLRARAASSAGRMLTRGPISIDAGAGRAFLDGKDLQLTQKELALLLLLARGRGESVAGEALYEAVWQTPMAGDSSALRTQLSRLKGKLEMASGGAVTIFSVRGEGYCLIIA